MPRIEVAQQVAAAYAYLCDWCGADIAYSTMHPRPCCVCGRYACYRHNGNWVDDPDWPGDSPDRFCGECWKIGEPYRYRIAECEAEAARQRAAWYASVATPPPTN